MLEPRESIQEVEEWLLTLRLSQYTPSFLGAGYKTLDDCRELTEERLLELNVLPTGHRRRLLCSLEVLGMKQLSGGEGEEGDEDEEAGMGNRRPRRKPVPHPRNIFLKDKRRGLSYQHPQVNEKSQQVNSHTLPPGSGLVVTEGDPPARRVRPPLPAPCNPENIQLFPYEPVAVPLSVSSCSSSSSSESPIFSEMPSDWDISPEDPTRSSTDSNPVSTDAKDTGGFTGEMVENSIYEAQPHFGAPAGPWLTRSYHLRHRPVPEIPSVTPPLLQER